MLFRQEASPAAAQRAVQCARQQGLAEAGWKERRRPLATAWARGLRRRRPLAIGRSKA
jgi:hypothetical protein